MCFNLKKLIDSRLFNTILRVLIVPALTAFFTIWFAQMCFVPNTVLIENKITAPSKKIEEDVNYYTDIYFSIKNKGMVSAEHIKIEFIINGGKVHDHKITKDIDWEKVKSENGEDKKNFQIFANIPRNKVLDGTITIKSYQEYNTKNSSPLKIIIK